MPLIPLFQAIAARILLGFFALTALFGLDSLDSYQTYQAQGVDTPTENVIFEELSPSDISEHAALSPSTPEEGAESPADPPPAKEEPPKEDMPAKSAEEPSPEPKPEEDVPPEDITQPEEPAAGSLDEINLAIADAVVNILCTTASGPLKPISGSGVIIDSRGVILTNAHIAQYFLLEDYPVKGAIECIARTGSPAAATYTLEAVYISPVWIELHAEDITNPSPTGTGQHDFAFLRITGRTDPSRPLPQSFSHIPLSANAESIELNDEMLIRSYPAGFLGGISIQKNLYAAATIARVKNIFTFDAGLTDLIGLTGTISAQGGSSGGAVVDKKSELVGIVVTASREEETGSRELRAITAQHIDQSVQIQNSSTVAELLAEDLAATAHAFNVLYAPTLTQKLLSFLD